MDLTLATFGALTPDQCRRFALCVADHAVERIPDRRLRGPLRFLLIQAGTPGAEWNDLLGGWNGAPRPAPDDFVSGYARSAVGWALQPTLHPLDTIEAARMAEGAALAISRAALDEERAFQADILAQVTAPADVLGRAAAVYAPLVGV